MRRKIVINDPVHRVMNFGSKDSDRKVLKAVIDTPEFQRLRRISQLGLASYVFPGATHSRFNHGLGAAYLASSVVQHLQEIEGDNGSNANELGRHRIHVILCALLHDLGHGPFSHSFEKVLKGIDDLKDVAPLHERWTAELISNSKSKITKALMKNDIDPSLVASVWCDGPKHSLPTFLKQIVSSQLDVDRMDYLLRDSHFAGVSIGEIDVHYLINTLCVIDHDKTGSRTLGLVSKGVKVYETYAVARQFMNRSIYFHHKVKVIEFMMEELLRQIILNVPKLKKISSIKNFIPAYFEAVSRQIEGVASNRLTETEFVNQNARAYLALTEDSVWSLIGAINQASNKRIPKRISDLCARLVCRDVLPYEMINSGKEDLIRTKLKENGYVEKEDYRIISLSSTIYEHEESDEKVFVRSKDRIEEITSHSEIIAAFRDKAQSECILVLVDPSKEKIFKLAASLKALYRAS